MKQLLPILLLTICLPAFSQVIKLSTNIKFQFVEGPVWDGKGALYFSDMNAKKVYKYLPEKGFSVVRNGQITNGMAFDSTKTLIVCEQGPTNQVVRMDTLGNVLGILVNRYNSKPFNNPNDLCIDKKGGIYFSDPTWGTQVQDKQAIYYLKPSGECIRISGDFKKPNGNCLSPDGTLLYVDDSNDKNVYVFDVQPDGMAINKRIFCVLKLNSGTISSADGMKVDSEGNLYITSVTGVQVFDKTGKAIKIISVPEGPTNVAFGGKDWKTLFITAGTSLYSTQVDVPGIPIYTSVKPFEANSLGVYPNPTSGSLTVSTDRYESIKVYNLAGVELMSETKGNGSAKLDLSHLHNGMYLVKIQDGSFIQTTKVILRK